MSDEDVRPAGTLSDALRRGRKRLASAATATPGLDAEVLLRHVLGIDRTELFVRLPEPIAAGAFVIYDRLLEERARDIPVAYLTGEREFMGLTFEVAPGVLVPRPETELLVAWAISWLGRARARPRHCCRRRNRLGRNRDRLGRGNGTGMAGTHHCLGHRTGRHLDSGPQPHASRYPPSRGTRPGVAHFMASWSGRSHARQSAVPAP